MNVSLESRSGRVSLPRFRERIAVLALADREPGAADWPVESFRLESGRAFFEFFFPDPLADFVLRDEALRDEAGFLEF